MRDDGADIVDVGGESTRPGAAPTPPEIERARVVPVIRGLASAGVLVSVDTCHADDHGGRVGRGRGHRERRDRADT